MQQYTLDDAITNLDTILAHLLIEQDLRLKGIQVGHGWQQLTVIKTAITKLGFMDRYRYKKKLQELEQRLNNYEEQYISEVEFKLALDDVQKVNDLLNNYKTQLLIDKRKDIEEKLEILKTELLRIQNKNKLKTEQKWIDILKQINGIIVLIDNILQSKNEVQFTDQREQMNHMLQTIYTTKRIKEEEEEELLNIAMNMEQVKMLQRELDIQLKKDDDNLNQVDNKQSNLQKQQNQNSEIYGEAYKYVQMRRRTKVKLFFQGIFTAIGAMGGKIGAALGFAFGTITGKKVSENLTKSSIN